MANHGTPPPVLIFYFLLGTVFMRAAGCVVNDIADRNIDKHVARTKHRPLTSGEVSLSEAIVILFFLLFFSLCVLIQLPPKCFYYALIALFVTILYPFCKRFFQAPQLILSLAFSMGIPMAYIASNSLPNENMWILFVLNFIWIVAYDTMYAMADRKDDLQIGVKSTAILFAHHDRSIILLCQLFFHGLWIILAKLNGYSNGFYILWVAAIPILIYQQILIRTREPTRCIRAFSTNSFYGLIMWVALVLNF